MPLRLVFFLFFAVWKDLSYFTCNKIRNSSSIALNVIFIDAISFAVFLLLKAAHVCVCMPILLVGCSTFTVGCLFEPCYLSNVYYKLSSGAPDTLCFILC